MKNKHNGQVADSISSLDTAQLLCTTFRYLTSAETTPLKLKTEWHYLLALVICFVNPLLPQLWQHKAPTSHKNTHALPPPVPCIQMWSSTRVVNYCQHGPTFFSLSSQPSELVLSALLLIFIFLQNFNLFVPQLSCLSIVSMPIIATCSCCLQCDFKVLTFFSFFNTCSLL